MSIAISALEYINSVKNGSTTAEEFVAKTLEQISRHEGRIHAFISLNDKALDQAREIDKKIKSKERPSHSIY